MRNDAASQQLAALAAANVSSLPQASTADTAKVEAMPAPKAEKLPLQITFADQLPSTFTPPDELVQGVVAAGGGSIVYGDSNSGKTFFCIDMAAAVARGSEWMGRHTEQGFVVYLAAESPSSVASRLQAYQTHHGVRVPNFAIVQNAVNLFKDDADTKAIIKAVRMIEEQRKQKVRLIVGDTLARLSAGANENAGQDMGLVIERFDRIRNECNAHFMLIHHSGKNVAAGARGWSGIRAAVDTEIEVTDQASGRCAEITKDRDLGVKGVRIGFKLDVVQMGTTKWGGAASTCVVSSAETPSRSGGKGKQLGKVESAVVKLLSTNAAGIKKGDVVKRLEGSHAGGPVYRAIKNLCAASLIHEAGDLLKLAA